MRIITEREKWDTRHAAGAILSGIYRKVEPKRRHELSDVMLTGATRMDTVAGWVDHVCGRFGVALEDVYPATAFGGYDMRVDVLMARIDWDVLRACVMENASLLTIIAKDGPLPDELAPGEEPLGSTPEWTMPMPTGELIPVPSLRTVWTAQGALSHGADETRGNVILFRREPLTDLLTGRVVYSPFISGNSIRHSWRKLAVDRLYTLIGIGKGEVNRELHHALTSGGTIDAGSEMSKVDPGLRQAMRHLFPAWELLGGVAEKQMCHGAWNVHDAILVCRENVSRLMHTHLFPCPAGLEGVVGGDRAEYARALAQYLRPALSFMTIRQYTKHSDPDVGLNGDDSPDPNKRPKRHMLYDVEVAQSGSQWLHYVTVHKTATEFARACVSDILSEFADHPYLASQNGRGHGLVAFDAYSPADESHAMPGPDMYLDHLEKQKPAIVDWLTSGKVPASMREAPALTDDKPKRGRKR